MPQQINLQSWLNARLFRQTALHLVFRDLYKLKVDLDYVHFLCGVFVLSDALRPRRRGLIPLPQPSVLLKRANKGLGELRLSEALQLRDALKDPVEVEKLLDLKEEADAWFDGMNHFLNTLKASCEAYPLVSLHVKFGWPREFFNARGDPGDRWGSFFLLAITEYLRAQTCKPRYRLAYRLFRGLRKDAKDIHDPKHDVAGRIAQLKRAHPDWQTWLEILESEYQNQPDKVK